MAGHSKWHNIQHRKGAQDAKRGKIFTKFIREITVAAKAGGPEVENNPSLRSVIEKALGANMTRDTIDRAVKRGAGTMEGDDFDEITYEGYGPAGVAVMAECLTDNKNRTVAEVRHAFSKAGGNLGTSGSVAYLFTKIGVLNYDAGCDEDAIMEAALELDAEDVVSDDDGSVEVVTGPDQYIQIKEAMTGQDLEPNESDIIQRASTSVDLNKDDAEKLLRLIDALEELDDVQAVHHNGDISAEVAAQLAEG